MKGVLKLTCCLHFDLCNVIQLHIIMESDRFCGILEQKLFQGMHRVEQQLQRMLETITVNVGYPVYLENLDILLDYKFYFEISSLVFPDLSIKIIKIGEDQDLTPPHKIQSLLQLLTGQLQINLLSLSGEEMLKGHFLHLHSFLQILLEFSEYRPESAQPPKGELKRLKTCPNLRELSPNSLYPKSCPEKFNLPSHDPLLFSSLNINNENLPNEKELQTMQFGKEDEGRAAQTKGEIENIKRQQFSMAAKSQKKKQIGKKIYEKNSKKVAVARGNKKYKTYLQNFMKQQKRGKKSGKSQTRPKSALHKGSLKEVKEVDDFFRSFSYKIRDQKLKYLRQIEQKIRAQQNQRMLEQSRFARQKVREAEARHDLEMSRLNYGHNMRRASIKEQAQVAKQSFLLMKKQYQKRLRSQQAELREKKKKELSSIKNEISQANSRIFMKLEEGGPLERVVLNFYKKF